jgi:hypothetical protein
MVNLTPAVVMAEHRANSAGECMGDNYDCGYYYPCPTYRLAEALSAAAALHYPDGNDYCMTCANWSTGERESVRYPCPTALALEVGGPA